MGLSRRHAIVGATAALAGCSALETEVGERAERVRSWREHPLSGKTIVSLTDRGTGERDLEQLTMEALAYWTANAAEHADFEITALSPDIGLVFLESGSELRGCRERTERDVLGCAPLLQDGSRPGWPVTIGVVAGSRPADGAWP